MLFDSNGLFIAMIIRIVTVNLLLSFIDLPGPVTCLAKTLRRAPSVSGLFRNRTRNTLPSFWAPHFEESGKKHRPFFRKGFADTRYCPMLTEFLNKADGCILVGLGVVQFLSRH